MSRPLALALAAALVTALAGCGPNRALVREATAIVAAERDAAVDCVAERACAAPTPLADLARRAPHDADPPRHYVTLLERGEPALALRTHLIRAATRSIDVQTFIFTEDDTGFLTLNELLAAARRGVKVRVLTDQLFSLDDVGLLSRLAHAHANFELRVYNPTFDQARTAPLEFAFGILCCFFNFNHRMHNKLMVVDGLYGINGGRNVDDRYYDWSDEFNYRDRDVLVVGPAVGQMQASFAAFWAHEKVRPLAELGDVASRIVADRPAEEPLPAVKLKHPERIVALDEAALDATYIRDNFVDPAYRVGRVEYFSDPPGDDKSAVEHDLTARIAELLVTAERRITMQTPYLVFSKRAQKLLRARRARHPELRFVVSTNSLAATDAFYVYAISHKYKRRYLKKLGMEIYEYKPFAGRGAPTPRALDEQGKEIGASGIGLFGSRGREVGRSPLPLVRPGVRRGMHAKSFVMDGRIAMIGSHNFDPRSDELNTESGVIVWDEAFALALERTIEADMAPDQSWVIAKKPEVPVVSQVSRTMNTVSESVPLVDLWPFRYATSYELRPGCEPVRVGDPRFAECYEPVGEFPEVALSLKQVYTRIVAAFGGVLVPIL